MTANDFDNRLRELSAMTASDQVVDLWSQDYAELLEQVRADGDNDRRTAHAGRMKKLLMIQAEFLVNEWLKYNKAVQGPYTTRGGNA